MSAGTKQAKVLVELTFEREYSTDSDVPPVESVYLDGVKVIRGSLPASFIAVIGALDEYPGESLDDYRSILDAIVETGVEQ